MDDEFGWTWPLIFIKVHLFLSCAICTLGWQCQVQTTVFVEMVSTSTSQSCKMVDGSNFFMSLEWLTFSCFRLIQDIQANLKIQKARDRFFKGSTWSTCLKLQVIDLALFASWAKPEWCAVCTWLLWVHLSGLTCDIWGSTILTWTRWKLKQFNNQMLK